jgi:hypothetical protein
MLIFKSLLFSLIPVVALFAQEQHNHPSSSEVPELWEFHETIYQIWHEAWPAKDMKLLKNLIPNIEEGYAQLKNAELPHILHEKQDKWSNGIKNMGKTIEDYKTAANKSDSSALLNSAEELHTQFEFLVRAIRPALKELDYFHQELYMLYHYYMPEYDYDKIKISVKELSTRMESLSNAKLSKRYQSKQEEFNQHRDELLAAVIDVNKKVRENSGKEKIISAIETMHTKYRELHCVFE